MALTIRVAIRPRAAVVRVDIPAREVAGKVIQAAVILLKAAAVRAVTQSKAAAAVVRVVTQSKAAAVKGATLAPVKAVTPGNWDGSSMRKKNAFSM